MTDEAYDAILLLGGFVNLDGSLKQASRLQVQKAVELHSLYHCPIVASGLHSYKSEHNPVISEAKAFARYAEKLGVDYKYLYLEEHSLDTVGNILFAKTTILMPHNWLRIVIVPSRAHLTERVAYIAQKVLGPAYDWTIARGGENLEESNVSREKKALKLTREINDPLEDGDHDAIYTNLLATHPAYGGTKWTIEELRKIVGHASSSS